MIGPLSFLPLAELQMLTPSTPPSSGLGAPELLLAVVCLVVLLSLLRPSRRRRRDGRAERHRPARRSFRLPSKREKNWILVDGSNVMHWEDNTPQIEPVRRVVATLKERGLDPGVVFDANVGWKLVGRYLAEYELSDILGLPQDQVLVVPKGSPADPWLLTTARDFGARIVTNDRFRDWAGDHPEVATPGFLVRGGVSGDKVWLEGMPDPAAGSRA
jgi:hypothetical protein